MKIPDKGLLLSSAQSFELAGDYDRAYELLKRCDHLQNACEPVDPPSAAIKAGLWRLAPLWWAKLEHDDLRLRRCHADDAEFFRQCYADSGFIRQFNRQRPWSGNLAKALLKSGKLPPIQTGLLMWVIESKKKGSIGLASFSSIDTANCKMELSIGFPGEVPSTLGVKTGLMMLHFALVLMPFNKVYAYVYEDNPQALHNALRCGFVHEGMLRDHFKIPGHGYVNVNLIGLTRGQLNANETLKSLAKRRIGQIW